LSAFGPSAGTKIPPDVAALDAHRCGSHNLKGLVHCVAPLDGHIRRLLTNGATPRPFCIAVKDRVLQKRLIKNACPGLAGARLATRLLPSVSHASLAITEALRQPFHPAQRFAQVYQGVLTRYSFAGKRARRQSAPNSTSPTGMETQTGFRPP